MSSYLEPDVEFFELNEEPVKEKNDQKGMKFDTGKLRFDLIPPEIDKWLAEILTYGAAKYEPNNWQKVDAERYWAALYRHLNAFRLGEQNDQESEFCHLHHALCNIAFLAWKNEHDSRKSDTRSIKADEGNS